MIFNYWVYEFHKDKSAITKKSCTPFKFSLEMESKLAEIYFEKNKKKFQSIGPFDCKVQTTVLDSQNNEIIYYNVEEALDNITSKSTECDIQELSHKLELLAQKIEENADLFAQLEFLIRHVPVQEIKDVDIQLIIQNLRYLSLERKVQNMHFIHLIITADTPLASLGCVAQVLMTPFTVFNITADKHAAVVCHLFAQLCHEVGLDRVSLLLVENLESVQTISEEAIEVMKVPGMQPGCTGIISALSDLAAAVDTLIESSCRYPWALQRLLVQENIYEKFDEIMTSKASNIEDEDILNLKKSNKLFLYKNKIFLLNSFVKNIKSYQIIKLECYTTNKELISILNEYKPFCLSVWSRDMDEANEIANKADATIVWLNSYSVFNGPSKCSQCFFSSITLGYSYDVVKKRYDLKKYMDIREQWLNINMENRLNILRDFVNKYCDLNKTKLSKEIKKSVAVLLNQFNQKCWDYDTFFHVLDGMTCTGVDKALEVLALPCCYDEKKILTIDFIKNMLHGSILIRHRCIPVDFFEMLLENGVPVMFLSEYQDDTRVGTGFLHITTKLIWNVFKK